MPPHGCQYITNPLRRLPTRETPSDAGSRYNGRAVERRLMILPAESVGVQQVQPTIAASSNDQVPAFVCKNDGCTHTCDSVSLLVRHSLRKSEVLLQLQIFCRERQHGVRVSIRSGIEVPVPGLYVNGSVITQDRTTRTHEVRTVRDERNGFGRWSAHVDCPDSARRIAATTACNGVDRIVGEIQAVGVCIRREEWERRLNICPVVYVQPVERAIAGQNVNRFRLENPPHQSFG